MPEYYFNSLNPTSFQRLVNGVLVATFNGGLRLMPLRGKDGGRDAEAVAEEPEEIIFAVDRAAGATDVRARMKPGRYMFQVKFHRTADGPLSTVRHAVVADLAREVQKTFGHCRYLIGLIISF
jgi:hypothetical protein